MNTVGGCEGVVRGVGVSGEVGGGECVGGEGEGGEVVVEAMLAMVSLRFAISQDSHLTQSMNVQCPLPAPYQPPRSLQVTHIIGQINPGNLIRYSYD